MHGRPPKGKPGAFPNFPRRNREKMCTRGIELTNIDLPGAFKW